MRRLMAAALLLLAWPAEATETRIQSLGGSEQGFLVLDELNALYLPSTLVLYPNTTFAEFGAVLPGGEEKDASNTPYSGLFGIHYALGTDTVLAFYGSSDRKYVLPDAVTYIHDWSSSDLDEKPVYNDAEHKGTVMLAHRMGSLRLGGRLGFWGRSVSVDEPESSQMKSGGTSFEVGLGVGYDLAENQMVDLAANFTAGWFDDDVWGGDYLATRLDVATEWQGDLLARGVFKVGQERIVPFVQLGFGGGGVTWNQDVQGAPETTLSRMFVALGTNLLMQPLEGVYIMPGLGMRWVNSNLEDDGETVLGISDLVPYVDVAVDAKVASWLAIRFAARQNMAWSSTETAATQVSQSNTSTEMTLGLGAKLGQVDIDWMVNPSLLVDGPWALSGTQSPFATQASVKFTW